MEDYAANSKKSKEVRKPKAVESSDKQIEKVVTGEVVQRKKTLGERFKHIFFGGEARGAIEFVFYDVLVPAAKDTVVKSVSAGIERAVFGEASYKKQAPGLHGGSHIFYNKVGADPRIRSRGHLPDQPSRPRPRSRRNGLELILETRNEAEMVFEQMSILMERYEVVSIADLNELIGMSADPLVDQKWGWYSLVGSEIRQVRGGFVLDLPEAEPLN